MFELRCGRNGGEVMYRKRAQCWRNVEEGRHKVEVVEPSPSTSSTLPTDYKTWRRPGAQKEPQFRRANWKKLRRACKQRTWDCICIPLSGPWTSVGGQGEGTWLRLVLKDTARERDIFAPSMSGYFYRAIELGRKKPKFLFPRDASLVYQSSFRDPVRTIRRTRRPSGRQTAISSKSTTPKRA